MRGEAAPVARPPITAPNKNFLSRFGSTFYLTINFEKGAKNFANDFNPYMQVLMHLFPLLNNP